MTDPPPAEVHHARRRLREWALPAAALMLAFGSVALSVLALPALIAVILVAARSTGGMRWLVAVLGGVASTAGLLRFTLEWAVPNIVSSGQFAAEERAVSRLREILWSEDRVRERVWIDTNADGTGEYAFLGELAAQAAPRPGAHVQVAMLRPAQFHPLVAGSTVAYRSEGYLYTVYLPGPSGAAVAEAPEAGAATSPGSPASPASVDPAAAARYWVAYAWPAERNSGGVRAFYIDQDDRICETDNAQGYSGSEKIPLASAAISVAANAAPCGASTGDGGRWRAWKNKKPRASRADR